MEELTDKDLHCIARQLQSAWCAPEQEEIDTYRMFYGCWYCKYSHECKTPNTMNLKKALNKLSELTGVDIFPSYGCIWRQFLPASIFIEYPEELQYLEKHHAKEYQNLKDHLNKFTDYSKEESGFQ